MKKLDGPISKAKYKGEYNDHIQYHQKNTVRQATH